MYAHALTTGTGRFFATALCGLMNVLQSTDGFRLYFREKNMHMHYNSVLQLERVNGDL